MTPRLGTAVKNLLGFDTTRTQKYFDYDEEDNNYLRIDYDRLENDFINLFNLYYTDGFKQLKKVIAKNLNTFKISKFKKNFYKQKIYDFLFKIYSKYTPEQIQKIKDNYRESILKIKNGKLDMLNYVKYALKGTKRILPIGRLLFANKFVNKHEIIPGGNLVRGQNAISNEKKINSYYANLGTQLLRIGVDATSNLVDNYEKNLVVNKTSKIEYDPTSNINATQFKLIKGSYNITKQPYIQRKYGKTETNCYDQIFTIKMFPGMQGASLNSVPPGTSYNNRQGREIHSLNLDLGIFIQDLDNLAYTIRFCVFWDYQPLYNLTTFNGPIGSGYGYTASYPLVTDLFQYSGIYSWLNITNVDRFRFLYDKYFTLNANTPNVAQQISIPLEHLITVLGAPSLFVSTYPFSNALYFVALVDNYNSTSLTPPTLVCYSRYWFDNN